MSHRILNSMLSNLMPSLCWFAENITHNHLFSRLWYFYKISKVWSANFTDKFSFIHAILFNFIIIAATVSLLYSYSYVICNILAPAAAAAKLLQSCPTLCNLIEGSLPGSPVPGILQARTLEWVAISFSNAWKWKVKVKLLSRVRLLVTPWTAAYQAPLSMGFFRQEYWSGVPLSSPVTFLKP